MLSLIRFLMMSDVADAGSFTDFLKAIGNSIAHPERKSQSRTKSTKQPASKHTASPTQEVKGEKADVPYAIPVPGKQGFVTSPFAPDSGYIDVHQFPPGTVVKDPFTGKVFRTP